MLQASAMTSVLDSLRQNTGVCGASREHDHLSQLVEEFNGSRRQLCEAPDGCGMNFLGAVRAPTESESGGSHEGNTAKVSLPQATMNTSRFLSDYVNTKCVCMKSSFTSTEIFFGSSSPSAPSGWTM